MRSIIVVDDDLTTLETYQKLLTWERGLLVHTAHSRNEAVQIVKRTPVHMALVDLRLGRESGLDLLRDFRTASLVPLVVIVTAFATVDSAAEAMRLGACDYVEKPLIGDALLKVVDRNISSGTRAVLRNNVDSHAAIRWAHAVAPLVFCAADPKNLKGWSRSISASPGAIKNWCRTADVKPRISLVFVRLLRTFLQRRQGFEVQDLLNVVDKRTLEGLLKSGGFSPTDCQRWPTNIDEFLERQQLIQQPQALSEFRRVVRAIQEVKSSRLDGRE